MKLTKISTRTTDQYALNDGSEILVEHHYSNTNSKGNWKYLGESIWDPIPTFNSREALIQYIENLRRK